MSQLAHVPHPNHPSTALAQRQNRERVVMTSVCPGATKDEAAYLFAVADRKGLDPVNREIHLLITEYYDKRSNQKVRKTAVHTGIDGYRKIARRNPDYIGRRITWWDQDGNQYKVLPARVHPYACTCEIFVKGFEMPFEATRHMHEYSSGRGNWEKLPITMLEKVAESHALRAAFPEELAGLYTTDELDFENEVTVQEKQHPENPRPNSQQPIGSNEAPVTAPSDEERAEQAKRNVIIKGLKEDLFPTLWPGEDNGGIDWSLLKDELKPVTEDEKWGTKYPALKEWSTTALESVEKYCEFAIKAREDASGGEPEPEAVEGEHVTDDDDDIVEDL